MSRQEVADAVTVIGTLITVIGIHLGQVGWASYRGVPAMPCGGWPSVPGIQSFEFGLLALCGLVLLAVVSHGGDRVAVALAGLTGSTLLLVCFFYVPPWAFATDTKCLPRIGWYTRLLGGAMLLSAALVRRSHGRSAETGLNIP